MGKRTTTPLLKFLRATFCGETKNQYLPEEQERKEGTRCEKICSVYTYTATSETTMPNSLPL
jgi:hypothetical protein